MLRLLQTMGTSEVGLIAFCIMLQLKAHGGQGAEHGSVNKELIYHYTDSVSE